MNGVNSEQYFRNRREARFQGAWAFLDGDIFNKNNVITDGNTIYSYGRHFPMASRHSDHIAVNTDRYSVTTSKHQSALGRVLSVAGYEPTGELRDTGSFVWEVWKRSS